MNAQKRFESEIIYLKVKDISGIEIITKNMKKNILENRLV